MSCSIFNLSGQHGDSCSRVASCAPIIFFHNCSYSSTNPALYMYFKCDVIKQNQSGDGNIYFKIEPNKAKECLLFPLVFGILQLLISLEPIDQFQWGFLQNVALKLVHTVC